jgi:hypothetical protein
VPTYSTPTLRCDRCEKHHQRGPCIPPDLHQEMTDFAEALAVAVFPISRALEPRHAAFERLRLALLHLN